MALTIEGANVGFDSNGLQTLLDDIQVKLVGDTIDHLNNNFNTLVESLENIWQGQSEKIFIGNMAADLQKISTAIRSAGQQLQTTVTNMGAEVIHADEELVKPRQ